MTERAIPPASLERLRQAYANFEQVAQIVAEAMDIPSSVPRQIRLDIGVFVVHDEEAPNGHVAVQEVPA